MAMKRRRVIALGTVVASVYGICFHGQENLPLTLQKGKTGESCMPKLCPNTSLSGQLLPFRRYLDALGLLHHFEHLGPAALPSFADAVVNQVRIPRRRLQRL